MIYNTQQARKTACARIEELSVLLGSYRSGDVYDLETIRSIRYYLITLHEELDREIRENIRYTVDYEFLNPLGQWRIDSLTNNGAGYSLEEAREVRHELRHSEVCEVRNVSIIPIAE